MDRAKLLELLGPFPERVPLEARTFEVVDCGSYRREKVDYRTEGNERISAFVCVPEQRSTRSPAIFCHHQHNFEFTLGKSEVVGIAGDPDQLLLRSSQSTGSTVTVFTLYLPFDAVIAASVPITH